MNSDRPSNPQVEAEIRRWIEDQEPRPTADDVADAVIARVSTTHQGGRPSVMLTLATVALATVVAVLVIGNGMLLQRGNPGGIATPTPGHSPATDDRLPAGARVIPIGEPVADPVWRVMAARGTVWVEVSFLGGKDLVRIDPRTNLITARVPGVMGEAFRGDELWAMRTAEPGRCCLPAPLVQLDPLTGAVLRTIDGVEGISLVIDGDTAWTLNGTTLLRVDLRRGELVATVELGAPTRSAAAVVVGDAVWVPTNAGLKKVAVATNTVVATTDVPGQTIDYITSGDGSVWGVLHPSGNIVQIDGDSATVAKQIELPRQTGGVWGGLTVSDGYVWAAAPGGVAHIDAVSGRVSEVIPLPWDIYVGVTTLDGELWVTLEDASSVVRFPMPLD